MVGRKLFDGGHAHDTMILEEFVMIFIDIIGNKMYGKLVANKYVNCLWHKEVFATIINYDRRAAMEDIGGVFNNLTM